MENTYFTAAFIIAEFVLFMLLLSLGYAFLTRKRSKSQMRTIQRFIEDIDNNSLIRIQEVGTKLSLEVGRHVDPDTRKEVSEEIAQSEKLLMTKIVNVFVSRELDRLNGIQESITNLATPYLKLVSYIRHTSYTDEEIEQMQRQVKESNQLVDDIMKEYTELFKDKASEDDLQMSRRKILNRLNQFESRIEKIKR